MSPRALANGNEIPHLPSNLLLCRIRAGLAILLISTAAPLAGQQPRLVARDVAVRSLPREMAHQGRLVVAKRWTRYATLPPPSSGRRGPLFI